MDGMAGSDVGASLTAGGTSTGSSYGAAITSAAPTRTAPAPAPGTTKMAGACFQVTPSGTAQSNPYCQTCRSSTWTQQSVCEVYLAGALQLFGPPGANQKVREWLDALKATPTGSRIMSALSRLAAGSPVSIGYCDADTYVRFLGPQFGFTSFNPWSCTYFGASANDPTGSATGYGPDFWGGYDITAGPKAPGSKNPRPVELRSALPAARERSRQPRPRDHRARARTRGAPAERRDARPVPSHRRQRRELRRENLEESRTIGERSQQFLNEPYSENSIRQDLGLELRSDWCGFVNTQPGQRSQGHNDNGRTTNPSTSRCRFSALTRRPLPTRLGGGRGYPCPEPRRPEAAKLTP